MQAMKLMDVVKAVKAIDYTAADRFISVTGVEYDSRKIKAGDLFIPLTGGATDGHDYVDKAIAQGAVATLWSRSANLAPSDQIAVILVDDTLEAMQDLAHYYRLLLDPIVIGITGSNGKTTTKDMTANALKAKYKVHKTQGNFNNEIGLPYTILQMPEDTQVLVTEMGMSGFGEIERLSQIAQPDLAAITLIGESHLEFLKTRANIAKAKLEILTGLRQGGCFIYPGDEPLLNQDQVTQNSDFIALSFGFEESDDIYAYDLVEEDTKTYFRSNLDSKVLCSIPVMGAYNVGNALIALAIAQRLEVPIEQAIFQISQFKLTENRLEWLETTQGASLLNDAYNASPTSVRAVLASFSKLKKEPSAKKYAVLGDIRELGSDSSKYHAALADALAPEAIDGVFLFGPEMEALYQALEGKYHPDQVFYEREDHHRLVDAIQSVLKADDLIVVKSSLGTDMLYIAGVLTGRDIYNPYRTVTD